MTTPAPMAARATRHGYVLVRPTAARQCSAPINAARLQVTPIWAVGCFVPAYRRARASWGPNAGAISSEIVSELAPNMRVLAPELGAERELKRRVDLAVAALLNAAGEPTPYPAVPPTPRPTKPHPGPPWYVALLTGWLR